MSAAEGDRLPDLLGPGLRVVFCGTAASSASAARGAYYAGPGNRFWATLQAAGFTPERVQPAAFATLLGLGIGLTDLAKRASGVDRSLRSSDFDRMRLLATLDRWKPAALAFTSKRAAAAFHAPGATLAFGAQPAIAGLPRLFVLPSTSGSNAHWPAQQHHWREAARALGFA